MELRTIKVIPNDRGRVMNSGGTGDKRRFKVFWGQNQEIRNLQVIWGTEENSTRRRAIAE